MAYLEGWRTWKDGVLVKDGVLGRMEYKEGWSTKKDGVLGRMEY